MNEFLTDSLFTKTFHNTAYYGIWQVIHVRVLAYTPNAEHQLDNAKKYDVTMAHAWNKIICRQY